MTEFELKYKRTVSPEGFESITKEGKFVFDTDNMSPENADLWMEAYVHDMLNRQLRTLAINMGDSFYISVLKKKVFLNGGSR